jgi:prolyl-tRNA synthetase
MTKTAYLAGSVAPFGVGIINLKAGDEATDAACNEAYKALTKAGREPCWTIRRIAAGQSLRDGPDRLALSAHHRPARAERGQAEVKVRRTGDRHELSLEDAIARLAEGAFS